jgi:methyltransferase (TIGR00027 family)
MYAKSLAGDKGRELLERFGEFFTTIEAVRAKFFDESICKAVSEGVRQVVMLGAGLDARPYRLACLGPQILWVDVDYEPVLLYKGRVLQNAKPLCKVVSVGKDIRDADLAQVLAERGVNPGLCILWVAEGVFQYLKESEVEDILGRLRASSAPGSEIIFNAQNKANLVRTQYNARMLDLVEELGTPWTFTTESPADLLNRHGFDPKIIFLGHTQAHYGRLPWPPSDSLPTGFPCEWLATGHVKG